jgi:hypothetical protein
MLPNSASSQLPTQTRQKKRTLNLTEKWQKK